MRDIKGSIGESISLQQGVLGSSLMHSADTLREIKSVTDTMLISAVVGRCLINNVICSHDSLWTVYLLFIVHEAHKCSL